jgi:archaellum biogenesis protein FlaJ (TadC family)
MFHRINSLPKKYLSPAERLSEIIFGLIMVLTVTSTLKITLIDGEAEIRTMIFAAIGMVLIGSIIVGITVALGG